MNVALTVQMRSLGEFSSRFLPLWIEVFLKNLVEFKSEDCEQLLQVECRDFLLSQLVFHHYSLVGASKGRVDVREVLFEVAAHRHVLVNIGGIHPL